MSIEIKMSDVEEWRQRKNAENRTRAATMQGPGAASDDEKRTDDENSNSSGDTALDDFSAMFSDVNRT